MLTPFSIPKPFRGHIGIIQTNAIQSWTLLRPSCEIILFGNEEGTGYIADRFRILHVPEVESNEYGTPLLNSMFDNNVDIDITQNTQHNASGGKGIFEGPEAKRNHELAGGSDHYYTLVDGTWTLTPSWLRPAWGRKSIERRMQIRPILQRERRCLSNNMQDTSFLF